MAMEFCFENKNAIATADNKTTDIQFVACLFSTAQNKQRNSKCYDLPEL